MLQKIIRKNKNPLEKDTSQKFKELIPKMAIAMPEGGDAFSKAHEFLGNLFVKFQGTLIHPEELWPQFLFFLFILCLDLHITHHCHQLKVKMVSSQWGGVIDFCFITISSAMSLLGAASSNMFTCKLQNLKGYNSKGPIDFLRFLTGFYLSEIIEGVEGDTWNRALM